VKNSLVKVVLVALLLMLVTAPFAGIAPLMLIVLGFGVFWAFSSLVEAFFTADVERDDDKVGFESSRGE